MIEIIKSKKILIYFFAISLAIIVLIGVISVSVTAIENSKGIKVPIIMYHSVLNDESKANDYSVSKITLEKDLIYLQDNGYSTIFISDLINYVYKDKELPEKPVVLTFDDGNLNNLTYVLPLLKKYNMKANISVVGDYTEKYSIVKDDNPAYSYLSWDDINQLSRSKRVEIGNHSYDMHENNSKRAGSTKNKNESYEDYLNVFISDTEHLQMELYENCKIKPYFYTYPYGFHCEESEVILKNLGFKATLICAEKMNYITKSPDCLYLMNRYNRPSGISTEEFMNKALK